MRRLTLLLCFVLLSCALFFLGSCACAPSDDDGGGGGPEPLACDDDGAHPEIVRCGGNTFADYRECAAYNACYCETCALGSSCQGAAREVLETALGPACGGGGGRRAIAAVCESAHAQLFRAGSCSISPEGEADVGVDVQPDHGSSDTADEPDAAQEDVGEDAEEDSDPADTDDEPDATDDVLDESEDGGGDALDVTDVVIQDVFEDVPEDVIEDVPEDVIEDVFEDVFEDVPEDVSEDVLEEPDATEEEEEPPEMACFEGGTLVDAEGSGTCDAPYVVDLSELVLETVVFHETGPIANDQGNLFGPCPAPPEGTARDIVYHVLMPPEVVGLEVSVDGLPGGNPRIAVAEDPSCFQPMNACSDRGGEGECEWLYAPRDGRGFFSAATYVVISELEATDLSYTVRFRSVGATDCTPDTFDDDPDSFGVGVMQDFEDVPRDSLESPFVLDGLEYRQGFRGPRNGWCIPGMDSSPPCGGENDYIAMDGTNILDPQGPVTALGFRWGTQGPSVAATVLLSDGETREITLTSDPPPGFNSGAAGFFGYCAPTGLFIEEVTLVCGDGGVDDIRCDRCQ